MKKLTTADFIQKALLVHGDKYDYSKVEYQGNKIKVIIVCPIHGEFSIRPNDFLMGTGCPKCGGTKKLTTEEFISKASYVHNNYFSYEKCNYTGSNNKVIVTCPIHGDFEVKANNHLNGANCKKCQNDKIQHTITKLPQVNKSTVTYDTQTFVQKALLVHGDKYDYSKVEYIKSSAKVIITCPIHGDFAITPNHFLSGKGCPKCAKNHRYSTEEIINRFREIHGDKYDYSKVEYIATHKPVIVICPQHGEFQISPANHLRGQGCIKCYRQNKVVIPKEDKKKKDKLEKFVEKAKVVHNDKYDYSKVKYVNSETKVCIICPEHGEFWQMPYVHTSGSGCPKCGRLKSNNSKALQLNTFIEKAKQIHGNKYDYSKVNYVNGNTKVCIICPKHDEFWQRPSSHLNGAGCKLCFEDKKKNLYNITQQEFIDKCQNTHGNKYDYSKVVYTNGKSKICIICPKHGEFWQEAYSHSIGNGCPKCASILIAEKKTLTQKEFIENSQKIHGDKYNYAKVKYSNARDKVLITCPEHGDFWQMADSHMRGHGCPVCGNSLSIPENEIYSFLKENTNFEIEQRNRYIIKPYELDLYIPDKNIAIEFNGIYWHSSKFVDNKNKHLQKLNLCKANNIKLIQVFEDEWHDNRNIVLSKIRHLVNCNNGAKIIARKTIVKEIDALTAKDFLQKYHIQGYGISSKHLGCYYQNKLIAVMSFKNENNGNWELTRFASDYNYICCGVGGKLFKHFIREYNPNSVKSFADRRWTVDEENNVYIQLGFKFDGYTPPDYKYIMPNESKRFHKFGFRKKILLKKYPDILTVDMTEDEMTKKLGYFKIYDCGLIRYIWKKEE